MCVHGHRLDLFVVSPRICNVIFHLFKSIFVSLSSILDAIFCEVFTDLLYFWCLLLRRLRHQFHTRGDVSSVCSQLERSFTHMYTCVHLNLYFNIFLYSYMRLNHQFRCYPFEITIFNPISSLLKNCCLLAMCAACSFL